MNAKPELDWLVPDSVRREGSDAARRARTVVIGASALAVVAAVVSLIQFVRGSAVVGAGAGLLALSGLASIALVRRAGAWRPAGAIICVGLFAVPGLVTAATGGGLVTASFYLGLTPMLATLVHGARAGAITAAAAIALLTGVEFARRAGVVFPIALSDAVLAESAYRGALFFELILLFVALVYDSLRRASLRDVSESEARFRALGDRSRDLLLELGEDRCVCFVSREHSALFGWSEAQLLGAAPERYVHAEDLDRFHALIATALEQGTSRGEPLRLLDEHGEATWFEPVLTRYAASSADARIVVVARDLTERIEVEQRLRHSQKMDAVGQLGGRCGPRLQQRVDGRVELRRIAHRRRPARQPRAQRRRADPARFGAGRSADPADAGDEPQRSQRGDRRGSARVPRRHAGDARTPGRRCGARGLRSQRLATAGARRRRAHGAGSREPRRERARRDARRRRAARVDGARERSRAVARLRYRRRDGRRDA